MVDKSLEEQCAQYDFHINLQGVVYCQLALRRRVECGLLAKYKDHNGFWSCLNLKYIPVEGCYKA